MSLLDSYEASVSNYSKATEIDPKNHRNFLSLSESYLFVDKYGDSIDAITKVLSLTKDIYCQAVAYYFQCIAKRLNGEEVKDAEAELNRLLKEDFKITWDFFDMEVWLKNADISDEHKAYIADLTEKMKVKKNS